MLKCGRFFAQTFLRSVLTSNSRYYKYAVTFHIFFENKLSFFWFIRNIKFLTYSFRGL